MPVLSQERDICDCVVCNQGPCQNNRYIQLLHVSLHITPWGIQTWLTIPPFFIYIILYPVYPNTLPMISVTQLLFPWPMSMKLFHEYPRGPNYSGWIYNPHNDSNKLEYGAIQKLQDVTLLQFKTMFTGGGVYRITNVPHLTFGCYREPHPHNRQPTFWTCINLHIYKDTLSAFICSFERFLIICRVD